MCTVERCELCHRPGWNAHPELIQSNSSEDQGEDRGPDGAGGLRLVVFASTVAHLQVKDTVHIFRTLVNTARVYKNKVSQEVVRLERRPQGAKFEELGDLVSGARGRVSLSSCNNVKPPVDLLTFGFAGRVRDWGPRLRDLVRWDCHGAHQGYSYVRRAVEDRGRGRKHNREVR